MGKTLRQIIIRKDDECVTFTTKSSNQILKGKTQDTIDTPTNEETETAEIKKIRKLMGQTIFQLNY